MNANSKTSSRSGFTLIELLVIICIIAIIAALVLSRLVSQKRQAQTINCVNNLKMSYLAFEMRSPSLPNSVQMGALTNLAFNMRSQNQINSFQVGFSTNLGGTTESVKAAATFRHFQMFSNQLPTPLNTPKVLICPSDTRTAATNFAMLNNKNISYFVNFDTAEAFPQQILQGDRNIVADKPPVNGILQIAPGQRVRWTRTMHVNRGNIIHPDGSAQQCNDAALQDALKKAASSTDNLWFSMPE